MSNAELNGDRRHDAYHEKLRRSVEAVQDYNAGRELDEQFAITGSLLRQLTKVKPGKVKEWMQANDAELDAYDRAMDLHRDRIQASLIRVRLSSGVNRLMVFMTGSS